MSGESDGARKQAGSVRLGGFARMPEGASAQSVLLERLRRLAREDGLDDYRMRDEQSAILFRLGERERYAVPYAYADEVLAPSRITPVPCTPPSIAGVVSRRGELLTVLDLKQFFRTRPEGYGEDAHILVVSHRGQSVGLLTDELVGELTIDAERLGPGIPSEAVTNLNYVVGIHANAVTVLNIPALLEDPGLLVDERVN